MFTLLTVVVLVLLSLGVLGILLWIVNLAKRDVHITEIPPETGKLIKMGKDIVNILFNSSSCYYRKDGSLVEGEKQLLGWLFDRTGRAFFGISPIYEVFKFDVSWGEYVKGKPPSVIEKSEKDCTVFKRYYPHAVMINGAEMAKESENGKDTSTTRIDAVLLVNIEITNILNAVYKIPPQGIVFTQVNAALQGAFNDYVKGEKWEDFREEDKVPQNSEFVEYIVEKTNEVLSTLGNGMRVRVVELKYYDFTPSPENEALAESQTLLLIAENKGAAEVAAAMKHREARKIEGQGEADYLREVASVIGPANIAAFANLEKVADTQLRVYGNTNAVPLVGTEGDGKK